MLRMYLAVARVLLVTLVVVLRMIGLLKLRTTLMMRAVALVAAVLKHWHIDFKAMQKLVYNNSKNL